MFGHACKLGIEGIVSKRKVAMLRRSSHWIKSKNPNAPAVKREAEEDWAPDRRARDEAQALLFSRSLIAR